MKNPNYLALLSALLLWLAWPPMPFTTPLLFIAFVPLFVAYEQVKQGPGRRGKKVFYTAGLTFLVWQAFATYWIYNAVSAYNSGVAGVIVSGLVCLIPYGLGAALLTIAFWFFYRIDKFAGKLWAYLSLICLFIAMEYLQQTWDLAFPWMTLGNGLSGMHQLAQWYDITGIYGGSLWILVSNIVAFEAWKNFRQKQGYQRYRTGIAWLLAVLLPAAWSVTRYAQYTEQANPANVVVVQPNIDPYMKYENLSAAEQLGKLIKLSDSVAKINTEYFIWPETAIPNYANEERIHSNSEFLQVQDFLTRYKNGTVITGIESMKWYETEKTLSARYIPKFGLWADNYNAVMQVENSSNVQFYHKSKLVPGVEKLPWPKITGFLKPVFAKLGGSVGGWGWQEEPAVLYARSGIGVAPAVCYESLWGDWVGRSVKDGAQFIAVITNDGWWGNTAGKDQHLLYARLRAIENRRYVARSANTGISAIINQRGDIVRQTEWWKQDAINADIQLNTFITPYTKNGDLIAKLAVFGAACFVILVLYKRIKRAWSRQS